MLHLCLAWVWQRCRQLRHSLPPVPGQQQEAGLVGAGSTQAMPIQDAGIVSSDYLLRHNMDLRLFSFYLEERQGETDRQRARPYFVSLPKQPQQLGWG